jgi:CARDB
VTTWQISESAISVTIREDGRAELAFTVTNTGPSADRAVLTIAAFGGAAESWFTVDEPQRQVGPGMSVVYEVAVAVPPGTAAGTYAATGIVYSADTDPSESSATSKRIELVLAAPRPKARAARWPYLVAVLAVVLVAAVVGAIVLTRGGEQRPDLQVVTTPSCDVLPLFAGNYLLDVDAGVASTGDIGSRMAVPVRLRNERVGAEAIKDVVITPESLPAIPTTVVTVGVAPEDTGLVDRYTLTVDPDDLVTESDETNNTVTLEISLVGAGPVPCSRV